MDERYYMEIYEAVYFLSKFTIDLRKAIPIECPQHLLDQVGIHEYVYHSTMRILVVAELMDYRDSYYQISNQQMEEQRRILGIIEGQYDYFEELFLKATQEAQFFFHSISDEEYEVYSRYNYSVTYKTGIEVSKHLMLRNKSVLELGGNSGGLATALVTTNDNCQYTVLDTEVPCRVGRELNDLNNLSISFIVGDVFTSDIDETFDVVIIMNFLHDFNDEDCLKMLSRLSHKTTRIVVIEDILEDPFSPPEAVIQGLRLSLECRGGRQRTKSEMIALMKNMSYDLSRSIKISNVQTMLVFDESF